MHAIFISTCVIILYSYAYNMDCIEAGHFSVLHAHRTVYSAKKRTDVTVYTLLRAF